MDTLTNTLRVLKYYTGFFAANLPAQTDIGLLQLDSKLIKEKLLPTPKEIQEKIEKKIPIVNKERMEMAKKWLDISRNSSSNLETLRKSTKSSNTFVMLLPLLSKR